MRRLFVEFCTFCMPAAVSIAAFLVPSVAQTQGAFYLASDQELVGAPGTVIRREPIRFAPAGASAYRVLYRSKGLNDEAIATSGIIVIPPGSPPEGGRPIVAWAHPTTGIVPRCAPSLALFHFQQIQGLRNMIEHGFIVAATDYPGLGTVGPHPYLVGISEGRAVLDSVRAARAIAGLGGGTRFGVWGHSQGGQASLYAGLLAESYAPELTLVGVAAAAPATDLATLLDDDFKSVGGKNITAMTLWSWSRVYGAPIKQVVEPLAMPVIDRLAEECIESIVDWLIRQRIERPLELSFLSAKNLATVEPWRSLALRNTAATLPASVPIFLAQGGSDELVRPTVTEKYMNDLCRSGSKVRMMLVPGVGHGPIARDSAEAAIQWMAERFAGVPAPNNCGQKQ
jgi:pimeloyl-ACP methyl ester carboxylesterase